MNNIADVKLGLIAVSRDCFPIELSRKRRINVVKECVKQNITLSEIDTIIESEKDVIKALEEIDRLKINALVIYLGNFGPEGPTTLLAQKFGGPVMFAAAAEESGDNLINGRGDAYCGLLNTSYNCGLRKLKPYIPEYPVGDYSDIANMIKDFIPVARTVISVKKLKIFSFGPRPQDFLACNAPIKPLYDLGIEIMENSELDLLDIYRSAEGDPEIKNIHESMKKELGESNTYPDLLSKLAQYEAALRIFMKDNLGASEFGIFANKCWPAFENNFKFVPCYVNSRLADDGIPVSCETDIYGALSEYLAVCATDMPATLLDINNSVPKDMYSEIKKKHPDYKWNDLFMGFHCGNTPKSCMVNAKIKYQLIMHRLMEPDNEPDITRGTLEGTIRPGEISIFRLQSTADTVIKSYIADGEVLPADPKSFGGIGIFAIKEMGRFYRHVLIEHKFPHHTAIGFKNTGKILFECLKMLGVENIYFNQPAGMLYKTENAFK
jgi:L-fucose isomerase-like protein